MFPLVAQVFSLLLITVLIDRNHLPVVDVDPLECYQHPRSPSIPPQETAPSFAQSKLYFLSWSIFLLGVTRSVRGDFLDVHMCPLFLVSRLTGAPPLRAIIPITFKLPHTIDLLACSGRLCSATCSGYSSPRVSVTFSRLICITVISLSVILRWVHPAMITAP
ncbi:hypothetical protein CY34DRAFT_739219 [Suillus luteus UH-Slu-Lm8-n1]|uniref:Secreted protein n=1 Tax=Suillus luteus UH-Slu-Lm8-n1 TaxID=930992 RepID=A0A0C9Z6D3_9AGAM|nr:hypothetical protein CY34DRAFT_739219 [Suillus luteus UH-Slu-Lm8-n1]